MDIIFMFAMRQEVQHQTLIWAADLHETSRCAAWNMDRGVILAIRLQEVQPWTWSEVPVLHDTLITAALNMDISVSLESSL